MSHRETVIEPAAGLTVIAGDNNCGKSAIVAAIQCVCANATGHYMVRHGEKECRVILETDDGHVVEWRRANRKVSYVVDGETIDRTRGKVPEKVQQALRMGVVEAENEEFDIHFADQKSPVFLLDGTPGQRAAFFASSSDASKLIEMQTLHKNKLADAQRQVKGLNQRETELLSRLEILSPVDQLQQDILKAEKAEKEIQNTDSSIQRLIKLVDEISAASRDANRYSAHSKSLGELGIPPRFVETEKLEKYCEQIGHANQNLEVRKSRRSALRSLPDSIPAYSEYQVLHNSIKSIRETRNELARWQATSSNLVLPDRPSLSELKVETDIFRGLQGTNEQVAYFKRRLEQLKNVAPLQTADETESLAKQIVKQNQAFEEIKELKKELAVAAKLVDEAHSAFHQALEESGTCPTCGQETKVTRAGQ